jgi:hypothetical protein
MILLILDYLLLVYYNKPPVLIDYSTYITLLILGDYFLWGYYNKHPVYQHYSGLDFIYYHKNGVWGVGPKASNAHFCCISLWNMRTVPKISEFSEIDY